MKKKPVFLYVLLGFSTLGVLMSIYGYVQIPNLIKTWNEILKDEAILQQIGGVDTVKLQLATFEWARSLPSLSMTVLTTVLFGISVFFLFVKKDVVKSTYTYLAMRLAVFISWMVSVLVSNRMAQSIVKNKETLEGVLSANKMTVIGYAVLTILFSAIAYYCLRRYQKAVEEEVLDAEVL